MSTRRALMLAAATMLAGACGGSGGSGQVASRDQAPASSPGATVAPDASSPAASGVANGLPDAVVRDVSSGESVQIRSLIPAAKPILVWFWAPS